MGSTNLNKLIYLLTLNLCSINFAAPLPLKFPRMKPSQMKQLMALGASLAGYSLYEELNKKDLKIDACSFFFKFNPQYKFKSNTELFTHDYKIGSLLGRGGNAKVYRANSVEDNHPVAVKFFNHNDSYNFNEIKHEIEIMKKLQGDNNKPHPNICYLEASYISKNKDDDLYIVFELLDKELLEYMIEGRFNLTESEVSVFFKKIVQAVQSIHRQGIVHHDLKPENIMVSETKDHILEPKLIDFGSSYTRDHIPLAIRKQAEALATAAYLPPEAFSHKGDEINGEAVDIWSLGVILHILLTKAHPFDLNGCTPDHKIKRFLMEHEGPYLPERSKNLISSDAIDLLEHILQKDPSKRFTISQILSHPWLAEPNKKTSES